MWVCFLLHVLWNLSVIARKYFSSPPFLLSFEDNNTSFQYFSPSLLFLPSLLHPPGQQHKFSLHRWNVPWDCIVYPDNMALTFSLLNIVVTLSLDQVATLTLTTVWIEIHKDILCQGPSNRPVFQIFWIEDLNLPLLCYSMQQSCHNEHGIMKCSIVSLDTCSTRWMCCIDRRCSHHADRTNQGSGCDKNAFL